MMKRLYSVFIIFFLAGSAAYAQMAGDTESLTPSDVNLFVKSKETAKFLKTLNHIVFNLTDQQQRTGFISDRDKFRDLTGIDYLDEISLKNAGIDTGRPVSFANFDRDTNDDVMLLFLPVINEKESALKFIELMKRYYAGKPEISISSATATYKNVTVYQVKTNLYITSLNGYLLIGSTADILRRVIDVRAARKGSLMHDGNYRDYIAKTKNIYDINVFMTKKFIIQMNRSQVNSQYHGAAELDMDSIYNAVDYISAGLRFDGYKIQVNASVKLAAGNRYTDMLLGFLKTGVHDKSLYVPEADMIMFASMNLNYLDNLCKGEIDWCAGYNDLKQQIKTEYSIDVEKDFYPYCTGGFNLMAAGSATAKKGGDITIFIPMNDPKKTEELWGKIKKGMQTKYGKSKKFGDEKIGNKRGFWYIDESQSRIFISYDSRGIYAGNSTGLMRSAINSSTVVTAANSGRYGKLINDKTFFLLNIKKDTLIGNLLQNRLQGYPVLATFVNRSAGMFFYCENRDGHLSAEFEFLIKDPGIKK